ncbi:ATP-binding cassette domain-containing protein [Pelagibaculum spongiae]|uniref:ABC transporter ATP-binding protein n=1 Tax=Pelagibaculum spongiae TaxID=2080658 RepID=A0A2V1GZT3_9GAMM|nr:ATP-binding cassette domain-containing protein [Pelagibaculum spongiae]PVZ71949.1 ABC transporter ATP-binding protein [Pelagibaculum spongiae]
MSLTINNLSIQLNERSIIDSFNLEICAGEIWSIMGPSGCGKSTLLKAICGALSHGKDGDFLLSGEVFLNQQAIHLLPIEQRNIGLLFQDDLLFPHMDVAGNLAFALPSSLSKQQKQKRIEQALEEAELSGLENYDVAKLSGGQRARVSLMRALLAEPKAILLDEPFSKLDSRLRHSFRHSVFELIEKRNIPALLVTHDEADIANSNHLIRFS